MIDMGSIFHERGLSFGHECSMNQVVELELSENVPGIVICPIFVA